MHNKSICLYVYKCRLVLESVRSEEFFLTVLVLFLCLVHRDCLAFCTEPVFASLSNVLGQWDNLPSPVPTDIKEYKLYDVETKYGLLQVRVQIHDTA